MTGKFDRMQHPPERKAGYLTKKRLIYTIGAVAGFGREERRLLRDRKSREIGRT